MYFLKVFLFWYVPRTILSITFLYNLYAGLGEFSNVDRAPVTAYAFQFAVIDCLPPTYTPGELIISFAIIISARFVQNIRDAEKYEKIISLLYLNSR